MSNVLSIGSRASVKCGPGQPAFHKELGWCVVVSANGLMRQIDVVVDRKVSDTPDASLCGGVGPDEVMSEEIVYIETFDVDVRDLEEAMPVVPCNAKPLLFTGKVFDSKRTFSA